MRSRVALPYALASALFAKGAWAATSLVVPAGGGLGPLAVSVDTAARTVRYASCKAEPCAVSDASPAVGITTEGPLDPGRVSIDLVRLAGGKSLAHVKVLLDGAAAGPEAPAWEALLVAGAPPLFAGLTGWQHGEPGERSGTAVQFLEGEQGTSAVVIGEIREDLRVCGDAATLLDPRGIDPTSLVLRGATLQRLSPARREAAVPIAATARHAPAEPSLAPLLTATQASSAIGSAAALTDGDAATSWSEARPGRGQGEFVVLRAPYDVPITRFAVTVRPTSRPPKPDGAAPQRFYLATNAGAYEVTLPEDAWGHPGEAYDIALPQPLASSCVALVLADAFTRGRAHPEVTVAELTAYSSFDHPGATLPEVASALGGANGAAAAALLERAGAAGVAAVAGVYPTLDAAGRVLAVDVARSAPTCQASLPILVGALADTDDVARRKAAAKLEQPSCGREALPGLVLDLASADTRRYVAPFVALLGREKVLRPLGAVLGEGSPQDRHAVRAAVARAARDASAEDLAALLGAATKRSTDAALDALRALSARLVDASPAADAALAAILAHDPPVATRYLLVDIVGALARGGDTAAQAMLLNLLHDAAPEVRAYATLDLGSTATPGKALEGALRDESPRVREAALRAIAADRRAAPIEPLTHLLADDPWTFVRVAAAVALSRLPASAQADRALGDAMDQLSPRVREQAMQGLGAHGAVAYRSVARSHLTDAKEDLAVRVASARSTGLLCDAGAVEDLTHFAVTGASSPDPDQVTLGLVALEALGAIHPKDLAMLLSPLQAKTARPDARAAAARALAGPASCKGP